MSSCPSVGEKQNQENLKSGESKKLRCLGSS
ncbi:LRRC49 isoform 3, partial [Pongo abelii]